MKRYHESELGKAARARATAKYMKSLKYKPNNTFYKQRKQKLAHKIKEFTERMNDKLKLNLSNDFINYLSLKE